MRKIVLLLLSVLLGTGLLPAQSPTRVRGTVTDAETGEPMPYVSVIFLGTRIGTMTDAEGAFSLENHRDYATVSFQMLGYETQNIPVQAGRTTDGLQVKMKPDAYGLQSAVVTPKKGRDSRYRRRDNPAVELVRNVIAHKDENHVRSLEHYKSADYDKLILSLDDFNVDFDSSRFWRRFPFFEKYVDTAQFKNTPVLTISLREQEEQTYWHRQPPKTRTFVVRRRLLGFAEMLDKGGIGTNIEAIFADSDIFDENMEVMLNRFVSPINSTLATTFYKYYINCIKVRDFFILLDKLVAKSTADTAVLKFKHRSASRGTCTWWRTALTPSSATAWASRRGSTSTTSASSPSRRTSSRCRPGFGPPRRKTPSPASTSSSGCSSCTPTGSSCTTNTSSPRRLPRCRTPWRTTRTAWCTTRTGGARTNTGPACVPSP